MGWTIPKTIDDIPEGEIILFQVDYSFPCKTVTETHVGKLVKGKIYDTYEKLDIVDATKINRFVRLEEVLEVICSN